MTDIKHNLKTALSDDLNWASFLYLTDELSSAEVDLFEDQLAEREDLQHALIVTTRQLACLSESRGLRSDSVIPQPEQKPRRLKVIAVTASLAVCLIVAVLTSINHPAPAPDNSRLMTVTEVSLEEPEAQMLQAWVSIQTENVLQDEEVMDSTSDLSVPDWMLTAVLLEQENFDADDDHSIDALQPHRNSDSI